MSFFNVPTIEGKILFITEIQGQLSDGMWENAKPYDHWEFWGVIKPEEIEVSEKVGVESTYHNGKFCKRTTYGLNRNDFLDGISERMINAVKQYHALSSTMSDKDFFSLRVPESLEDFDWFVDKAEEANKPDDFYVRTVNKWVEKGITRDFLVRVLESDPYDIKALKKDLRALAHAMKQKQF